ncbi:MAG: aldehyde ferredoxin oxidoreductase family protein [Candidatus Jordarchaeaceae archaeon]
MNGYNGKILKVDLTDKKLEPMKLREEGVKAYIGGTGLAARLLFEYITPELDPFSPKNCVAYMTGPFTAARVPSGSRFGIAGLSALGYWGDSTSGGSFGALLKRAGFDGVIITGKAEKPVYIWIHEGEAELKDASHLWSRDCYETQDIIRKDLGENAVRVSCIGRAGEKLVRYACVINDAGRAAGRTGFGAIMGSKNLKALAVYGKAKPPIADSEKLDKLYDESIATQSAAPFYYLLREYGTMGYLDLGALLGDVPYKYFQGTVFPIEKIFMTKIQEKYPVRNYACFGCPIGCGKTIEFNKMGLREVDTPEYETMVALGPLCDNFDLDKLIYANHLCNAYGLDTISTGVSIAFTFYLFEKKVVEEKDLGMKLNWGDSDAVNRLIEMIAERKGFGNILAEGVQGIAKKYNVSMDEAAHVKGLEIPMHDPRAFFGQALAYMTSPRGADHNRPDWYSIQLSLGLPELGIFEPRYRFSMSNRMDDFIKFQDLRQVYESLLMCNFTQSTLTQVINMLNAITGWNYTVADILKIGERITNIKRAINNKRGITRKDDRMPKIAIQPLSEGATAGKTPNTEAMLKEYYEKRKWDGETGKPTKEKLNELDLKDVAESIYF